MAQWLLEHSLILLLAAGTVFTFIWQMCLKDTLRIKWYAALIISVLHTMVGVLLVTAFAFMESGFDTESLGNMSLFGAVLFMPLFYWLGAKMTKRSAAKVFDCYTICMIFTLMCARINCLFAGCCQGLVIPGTDGLHWPTRQAEILFYIVLLIFLGRRVLAGKTGGEIYPIYMFTYGGFRFVIEFFRYTSIQLGIFHISHIWAVISFCIGLSVYIEFEQKMKKKKIRR